jgi:hypothetical protein
MKGFKGDLVLDPLYFTMFDADLSDEITWPEFCTGTAKIQKPGYENRGKSWDGLSV